MQLLQSMFDPTSPIRTPTKTNDGISQLDHDTGNLIPAILFEKHHRFNVSGRREKGRDGGSDGVVASRLPLDETLAFLEIRFHPLSQTFITMYEFNMAGISALLVLSKSVSSKTTHFLLCNRSLTLIARNAGSVSFLSFKGATSLARKVNTRHQFLERA